MEVTNATDKHKYSLVMIKQIELRRFAQPMFMLNNIIEGSVCLP